MFLNREDAGCLALGAILANELKADLDVVLARKLRHPSQPELAIGAIAETGGVYLDPRSEDVVMMLDNYLTQERQHQMAEIEHRKLLYRAVRPAEPLEGRTVIVTDDGIATGSTMIAALKAVKAQHPHRLIVAVPVGAPDSLRQVRCECDEVICLQQPERFLAVGQFYEEFPVVDDEQAVELLRRAAYGSVAMSR
jgi:putative phosphoribosyl transferase